MDQSLILIGIIIIGFVIFAFLVRKWLGDLSKQQKPSDELLSWLKSTNVRMDEQGKNFSQSMETNTRSLNERLDKAAEVIGKVQHNIGEMSEIGRGMKELQDFLRSPKLRGNIGEQVLSELLTELLPKQKFHLQYAFKSGAIVDAAIQTGNGLIPIDSKFPLENFRKLATAKTEEETNNYKKIFTNDVRKHIRDISKKYILTEEGTIDYALMYIPSESVYYEVVNSPDLFEYAGTKRVLPVSSTTFYAYMQAILMSFEGEKIEKRAQQILASLRSIEKEYEDVSVGMGTLQKHLTNATNMLNMVTGSFSKLGQRIQTTKALGGSEEKSQLEE
ncbi:DNA recombination protein RmuC [Candidatus Microgenomates bacterium]|nr:DNA recombination protein RmuC [Candidatus Microgenomates bacterium]